MHGVTLSPAMLCPFFFGSAASMRKAITDNRRHVNRNIAWTFQQHCKLERSRRSRASKIMDSQVELEPLKMAGGPLLRFHHFCGVLQSEPLAIKGAGVTSSFSVCSA